MLCMERNDLMASYWIFKVKTEEGGLYRRTGLDLFQHRTREGFWGIMEYNEKGRLEPNIENLKKDDRALFYLVGVNGSSFLGSCVLASGFEKLDSADVKKIVHQEYLDCDQGVFLKDVDKWVKPLPIENLRGKDSFVGGGGKFGPYFQGSIKKIKTREEYDLIISEHELNDLNKSK
jgi:hypothetical protein